MKHYTDRDNNSNIQGYDYEEGWIKIYFKDNSEYLYTINSAGVYNIQQMQQLADHGDGLNSFINIHKPRYEFKR